MLIGTFCQKMLVESVLLHALAMNEDKSDSHFRAFEGASVLRGSQCKHLHAGDRRRSAHAATLCKVRPPDADAEAEGDDKQEEASRARHSSNKRFNGPRCNERRPMRTSASRL